MLMVAELPLGAVVEFGSINTHAHPAQHELTWVKVSENNDFITSEFLAGTFMFDQRERTNPNTSRQNNGNNFFIHSNIFQWLNSEKTEFWFSPQHAADSYDGGGWCYGRGGFLSQFTPGELSVMETVKVRGSVPVGSRQQYGKTYEVDCKVYLPSDVEIQGRMAFEGNQDNVGDKQFEYFRTHANWFIPGAMSRTPYNKSVCCVMSLKPHGEYRSVPASSSARVYPVIRLKADAELNDITMNAYGTPVYTVKGAGRVIDESMFFSLFEGMM